MTSSFEPATTDRHYYKLMAVSAACLVALAVALIMSARFAGVILGEDKPVEMFSAAGYLIVVVALFRETTLNYVKRHFYFVLIPFAMCLREMNFHVEFTTINMTKSSFYVSAEVPLAEKLIVIAIVLVLAWAGYLMMRRHGAGFINGLKRVHAAPVALCLAGISAVASKGLDGIARRMAAIGFDLPDGTGALTVPVEEVLELGIPLFMVIAVFASFPRRHYVPGEQGA